MEPSAKIDTHMEKQKPKKHKPKPKVSELDEAAAKRRRAQTCIAQRAFRQRKEDTIASLNAQVSDLTKTIDGLNECFLSLTDELTSSEWLKQDPLMTKALGKIIKRFITVVQASNVLEENKESGKSVDSGVIITAQSVSQDTGSGALLSLYQSINTVTDAESILEVRSVPYKYANFDETIDNGTSNHDEVDVQVMRSTAPPKGSRQPKDFQDYTRKFIPTHFDIFNPIPQLPESMNFLNLTFAQKLHLEAVRAGQRLVYNAENRLLDFHQVFEQLLNFHTRESIKAFLNRILNENFNQLLQPPPESNLNQSWLGELSCEWLNATDVAQHFRSIGIDFDGSLGVVNIEIHPGSLLNGLLNVHCLPSTKCIQPGDNTVESQYLQHPYNPASHFCTSYPDFSGTVQDASEFGVFDTNCTYSTESYHGSHVSIDVSRLIVEIIRETRCLDNKPVFNRMNIDDALARAVVEIY